MLDKIEIEPNQHVSAQIQDTVKTGKRRQLVIFVNLPGVVNSKVRLFLEHAKQRALRLGLECSALLVLSNENDDFTVVDVKHTNAEIYAGRSRSNEVYLRDDDLFRSNKSAAQSFISFIDRVDGYYDHILVLGEMVRTDTDQAAQYEISGIRNLNPLARCVASISEAHAASKVWQRVQICRSGSLQINTANQTFEQAVTPTRGGYYSSAPAGWSVLGKNGLAIDFLASNIEFKNIISFLYSAVANAWDEERIQQQFFLSQCNKLASLKASENVLQDHFDIKCIYPKRAEFEHLFSATGNPNSFFTAATTSSAHSVTSVRNPDLTRGFF